MITARLLVYCNFWTGRLSKQYLAWRRGGGGGYQALQILQQRYGRPCMIVSSVISSLVKGPSIPISDKLAIQDFADSATKALATLTSMNCLSIAITN